MRQDLWAERWQTGQIGFHNSAPNDLLVQHAEAFAGRARVYVPLCGKSVDLVWLFERGHDVVGSEFVGEAVAAFFAEQEQALEGRPTSARMGDVVIHDVPGLRIVQGDAVSFVVPAPRQTELQRRLQLRHVIAVVTDGAHPELLAEQLVGVGVMVHRGLGQKREEQPARLPFGVAPGRSRFRWRSV